jgi:selenocysteine lyase/cysteine desulfurase
MLTGGVFGNLHTTNVTSLAITERGEQRREYAPRYFNACADERVVGFTLNATGALKLIGDSLSTHSQTTRWGWRYVGALSPSQLMRKGGFHAARPD